MKQVEVYFLALEDEPKNGFYDTLDGIMATIKSLETNGIGFIVRKHKMDEDLFNNLPEFMGF